MAIKPLPPHAVLYILIENYVEKMQLIEQYIIYTLISL